MGSYEGHGNQAPPGYQAPGAPSQQNTDVNEQIRAIHQKYRG